MYCTVQCSAVGARLPPESPLRMGLDSRRLHRSVIRNMIYERPGVARAGDFDCEGNMQFEGMPPI